MVPNNYINRIIIKGSILVLLVFCPVLSKGQTAFKTSEYDLMALFIHNFTNYITWPEYSSSEEFKIVVYKNDKILAPLVEMAEIKKIKNKSIKVIEAINKEDIESCNILIVGKMKKVELRELSESLTSPDLLIISSNDGYAKNGSHINFIIRNEQIRFEINKDQLSKRELKVSSQLLKLAILVD